MIGLSARSRRVTGVAGSALTAAAFAMLPGIGWSSSTAEANLRDTRIETAILWSDDARMALPSVSDPFSRVLPEPEHPPQPSHAAAPPRQNSARVRAIATGSQPLALIDDGSVRIVTIGDAVRSGRVTSITTDAVVLSDGSHLKLDGDER